jgi:methionyl-tRNA formyltransferase
MRCLVFAYSEIGVVSLETLLALGEEVVGVVTHADHPTEVRWWRSVEELARRNKIPVITPEDPNRPEVLAWAQDKRPDVLFSCYYRLMLKRPLLDVAREGAFNLHGSLLPKFRGRAPINWAIVEGAAETGLSLHEMVEKPDAGDVLAQESVPILEQDTARDVFEKVVPLAGKILRRVVPLLREGRAPRLPQDAAQATYRGARRPADGKIDWAWPALRIHNLVRGVTRPYPGAFTHLTGQKVFVWKGAVWKGKAPETDALRAPGTVLGPMGDGVGVSTGNGYYVIQQAQIDGEKDADPQTFLSPGAQLGDQVAEEMS